MDRHRGHFVSLQLRCLRRIQSPSRDLLLQSLSLYQAWGAEAQPLESQRFSGDSNAMLPATMTQLRLGWTRVNTIKKSVIRKLLSGLSQPPKNMSQPLSEALCHHPLVLLILGSSRD